MRTLSSILFSILLSAFSLSITAANIDSLYLELNDANKDTSKIILLNKIAIELITDSPQNSLAYSQKALSLSKKINYSSGAAEAYISIAKVYYNQRIFSKASEYYFNALKIKEEMGDKTCIASISNSIGEINYQSGNMNQSLNYYYRALKLNLEITNKQGLANSYNNIGITYKQQGEYDKALNILNKALYLNRTLNNKKSVAENYGNVGIVMLEKKDYESKLFFEKELKIEQKSNNTTGIARSFYHLGLYYHTFNSFDSAILFFNRSLEYISTTNNKLLSEINKKLATIYANKHLYKEAYKYLSASNIYQSNLKDEETTKIITQYEMQQKFDKQLKIKKEQDKIKNTTYFILVGVMLILILIIVLLYIGLIKKVKNTSIEKEKLVTRHKNAIKALQKKQKKLTTSIMYNVKNTEHINKIISRLIKSKMHFKKQNHTLIESIIKDLQASSSDNIWEEFEICFQDVHSDFYKKLHIRYPLLTINEKRLCAFLRLNMTTKEIASITQQSTNSIEVARTRLRKKLNLSNKDISLSSFIAKM